jgi:SAM-dependent methyltransferase
MRPGELHAHEQLAVFEGLLPHPPAPVVEVGCGRGFLAAALSAAGYTVTAIDPDEDAVAAARTLGVPARQVALAEFTGSGFAAVICSRALHHIADLPAAAEHLARILAPDGVLLVDEFDRAGADAATAAWFYGTRALLATAGATICDDDASDLPDPLTRWHDEHTSEPPLHTAAEIRHALQQVFMLQHSERIEGLWIYLCQWLADTDHAGEIAAQLRDVEHSLIATHAIAPVGQRLTGRRR